MTYSPFPGEDEDLDAWIRQQAEASSLDSLVDDGGYGAQSMPSFQPPPHTEMAPLEYNTGPDWSDALGAGTTALAALADLGLNKGRGTGQILAAGGQFGQARAEQRLRGTQDALGYEQQRARMQYEQGQRSRNDELARGNLAARNAELEEMRARRLGGKGARQDGAPNALEASQANLNEARAYQLWNQDSGAIDPETQARLDQQRELQGATLEDRKAERAARAAERQQTRADRAQERAEKKETGDTTQFLNKTEETRSQAAQLKRSEPIIDDPKYAKDLPGVGTLDSRLPAWLMHPVDADKRKDAYSVESMAQEAGQYFKHELTGAASTDRENKLLMGIKGLEPGATEEEFRNSIGLWKQDLQSKLRARASANPGAARNALDAQGLGDWALGADQSAAGPPTSFNGVTNYGPDADHPSNLGVTDNVPKFSATPGGGAAQARGQAPMGGGAIGDAPKTYTVSMPGKPTLQKTLTPEDAAALRAAGAIVN